MKALRQHATYQEEVPAAAMRQWHLELHGHRASGHFQRMKLRRDRVFVRNDLVAGRRAEVGQRTRT